MHSGCLRFTVIMHAHSFEEQTSGLLIKLSRDYSHIIYWKLVIYIYPQSFYENRSLTSQIGLQSRPS